VDSQSWLGVHLSDGWCICKPGDDSGNSSVPAPAHRGAVGNCPTRGFGSSLRKFKVHLKCLSLSKNIGGADNRQNGQVIW
jgi:hypothetical protein